MDINNNAAKDNINKLNTQHTLSYKELANKEIPRRLPKKLIVPLPRMQKGIKMIINALKTPNLVAIIQN